ncbi:hypothetical protein DC522_04885 [Microvirga sp. KLBC 81]|uniref:hypothetical protein n=1 Tax=Microvirga sp. KLBC 81 TaxID=1862707 RepID=UPI000D522A70|nr:hypothetical protein [Microvirga sp. KLBC 81]PVE25654.1 hypothetical protein DC522_04885 [Microvirga sp. KLBC 81]
MDQSQFTNTVSSIQASGRIGPEQVLQLRRIIYGGRVVSKQHIEGLFTLDCTCSEKSDAWTDLYAEAIADFLVEHQEPAGYVDDRNADWLIEQVSRDGRIDTAAELEAVIGVLEKSKKSPERLVRFALEAARDTVLQGSGPARRGGEYKPGIVTEADVQFLRRILYAYGGDQHIAVSRAEAEVLFEINDATAEAENHPAWSDLFVKAVANSVLFYSGYTVPTREEALQRERWLDEPIDVGSFFGRMLEGLAGVFTGYRAPEARAKETGVWGKAEVRQAGHITGDEAHWLSARLQRDGMLHENERALLAFLRDKAVLIDPALQVA